MLRPLRTSIGANVRRSHLTGLSQVSFSTKKCEVGGFVEHFSKGDLVYADSLIKQLNPVFDYYPIPGLGLWGLTAFLA